MSRVKNWCFTSYNVDEPPVFDPRTQSYLCYGREVCPTTNRPHLQGYIQYKSRTRLPTCKKAVPGAHFEPSKGTAQENITYCSKDGNFTEFGSPTLSSGAGSVFSSVITAARENRIQSIETDYPGVFLRYKKTLESLALFRSTDLTGSCGVWICGPPRSGKDYAVRKFGNLYVKPLNKWWDGYNGEPNVLLSDVEPDHARWLGYFLKIWCDRYPFIAEIKGGSMKIRPERVYVTSNFLLSDVFKGEILGALQARMSIYDMFQSVVIPRPVHTPSETVFNLLLANGDGVLQEENNVPPAERQTTVPGPATSVDSEDDFASPPKKKLQQNKLPKGNSSRSKDGCP